MLDFFDADAGAARDCVGGDRPCADAVRNDVVERAVDAPDLGAVVVCRADVDFAAVLVLTG